MAVPRSTPRTRGGGGGTNLGTGVARHGTTTQEPQVGFTIPILNIKVSEGLPHLLEGLAGGGGIVAGGAALGAAGTEAAGTAGDLTAGAEAGGAGAAGAEAAAGGSAGGAFSKFASAINSPVDFLALIAWLFNPAMILRAVEFLVGVALMGFGFHAALQARGERLAGFSSTESALSRSELGRVAEELNRSARSGGGVSRPREAPHRTRGRALSQRYQREADLQRRRASAPRPKKST